MSQMGNLYLEISEKLEKELPAFKEALECGCNICEETTLDLIQKELEKASS